MQTLENLLKALANVIVQYHLKVTKSNYTLDTDKLIESKNIKNELSKLIQEATKETNTRLTMLNYIGYVVENLHPIFNEKKPLESNLFDKSYKLLAGLLIDMKKLLNTSDNETINVDFGHNNHAVFGLRCGIVRKNRLSRIGKLVEDLFNQFHLKEASNEEIENKIRDIITVHQSKLRTTCFEEQLLLLNNEIETKCQIINELQKNNQLLQEKVNVLQKISTSVPLSLYANNPSNLFYKNLSLMLSKESGQNEQKNVQDDGKKKTNLIFY